MQSVLLISDNIIASGCRYLMSALIENSIHCNMLIYKFDHRDNFNHLLKLIKDLKVSIIGMSIFSSRRIDFKNLALSIKNIFPNISIVCGGPDVNSNYEFCLDWSDFVCISDGEVAFPNLCKALLENRDVAKQDLPNIYFKRGGKLYKNRLIAEKNLDNYSFPYFSDNIYYISSNSITQYKDSAALSYNVYASRGCPYKCSYCANHLFAINHPNKKYYRVRSVDNVIKEILLVKKKNTKIKNIIFHDEQFGLNKTWFDEFICKYKTDINLPFFVQMNPKDFTIEKLIKLKECGLIATSFGMQSASPRIREIYRRPETLEDIKNANSMLYKLRISHFFDVIVDNPYEKKKDLEETLYFLLSLRKPFVAKTFDLIHLPDTELTKMLLEQKIIEESQVEGNYSYENEVNWRVRDKDVTMSFDEKYIVALIHLTGNVFVPNWIIKLMHRNHKLLPSFSKNALVMFLLSNTYHKTVMNQNHIVCLIRDKGFIFTFKKISSKITNTNAK